MTIKEGDPTINEILADFNKQLQAAGIDDVTFKTTADGCITYEGDITFNEDGTTSNFWEKQDSAVQTKLLIR